MSNKSIITYNIPEETLKNIKKLIRGTVFSIVQSFTNSVNAFSYINTHQDIDIILVNLSSEKDYNPIEIALEINRISNAPLLYINNKASSVNIQLTKTTKHYGFIKVPFTKAELLTKLEIALSKNRMERRMKDSREWLTVILKNIKDGVITTDTSGTITFLNTNAERLTGWEVKDAVGKHIEDVLNLSQNSNTINIQIDEMITNDNTIINIQQVELISKTKTTWIINYKSSLIKNKSNSIIGIVFVLNDITGEVKSQDALRESERLHRITLNSISDAVFITNNNGKFTYVCPNAEVIFGYTEDEIWDLGDISKLLGDNIFSMKELQATGEIQNIERKIINKFNKELSQLVNVKSVSIGEGTILYTCHDITELKDAQTRIARLNRMYFLLSEINEAIVRIRDNRKLFEEVCRIIVERGSFRLAWIGILDQKSKKVKPVSSFGFNEGYLENITISSDEKIPEGLGPTGQAVRNGKHFICNNIETHEYMHIWKKDALKRGYRSVATFPLWVGKEIIGALSVYAVEKDFFNQDEIYLFDRLGEDISLALTAIEYEKYLENETQSTIYDLDKRILNTTRDRILKNNNTQQYNSKNLTKKKHKNITPQIINNEYTIEDIITHNKQFKEQLSYLPEIAESDLTTMIYGESGTGKELVASAVKNLSRRKNKAFLVVNCAALPDNLLESELFGYVKGAFTGAVNNKIGLFQSADGGTIFLDEIGDISPSMQVKILRTLQEKEIIQLGSVKKQKIDVRFICATNKNLKQLVETGEFRQDLYYRLNVVSVNIPPLRDRIDDIPYLVEHFINLYRYQMNKNIITVDEQVINILSEYSYPGNVRELENIIKHAFIFCKGTKINVSHLPEFVKKHRNADKKATNINQNEKVKRLNTEQESEKLSIIKALSDNKWNILKTADELGIHRTTLWRKMKKYNIEQ